MQSPSFKFSRKASSSYSLKLEPPNKQKFKTKRKPLSTPASPSRAREPQCTCMTAEQYARLRAQDPRYRGNFSTFSLRRLDLIKFLRWQVRQRCPGLKLERQIRKIGLIRSRPLRPRRVFMIMLGRRKQDQPQVIEWAWKFDYNPRNLNFVFILRIVLPNWSLMSNLLVNNVLVGQISDFVCSP